MYNYKGLLVPEALESRVKFLIANKADQSVQSIYCDSVRIIKKCHDIACDKCIFECNPNKDPKIFKQWHKERGVK